MILIQISEIAIRSERRIAEPEHIRALAESMAEVGLLCPITIDKQYVLIAGLHRLEAAKQLGWDEIDCKISDLSDLEAEMAQIDENIIRLNLHYTIEGSRLARRKEIYEILHPKTKRGQRNGQTSKTETVSVLEEKAFAEDAAEKIGTTARTVRNKIQVATNLTPDVAKMAQQENITFKNALKLSRLEPAEQREAAEQLVSGRIKSVDDYVPAQGNSKNALPFQMTRRTFASVEEGVADLKNMDKDCSSTPGDFLAEVTAFVQKFQQEIEWFNNPYYEEVFPDLNAEQREYLRHQMDTVSTAAKKLYKSVERKSKK